MKEADTYPEMGWEYDDFETPMPSRTAVYTILGIAVVIIFFIGYAGYHGYELVSPYLP